MSEIKKNHSEGPIHAATFVAAHELAHIVQQRNNLSFNYQLPMLSSRMRELHADCLSGYLLELFQEVPFNYYGGLKKFVESLGSSHVVSTHGISEKRVEAMKRGMDMRINDAIYSSMDRKNTTALHMVNRCSAHYNPKN